MIRVVVTGFSRAPTATGPRSHYIGTSSPRNSVPYGVCSVMKMDSCAVKTALINKNDLGTMASLWTRIRSLL